ncbi:hypothetical protein E0Z10_g4411 [Xylaria hypoxylon]|uniref:Cytochrome P450 n=1 Tax=Xylaria hypoxylon TaxID=37992 RepID=A0A4Z0YY11_9PEZI|nr:hypothetical protein E0Z10_g4411 [Xylaria hypoxylon]
MPSISVRKVFFALVYLALIPRCIRWYLRHTKRQRPILDQVMEQRKIADFSFVGATTLDQRLKLRAKPNIRLTLAFDLNNSFTTSDQHVHQEFLKKAKRAIGLTHRDSWIKLGAVTQVILNMSLKHFEEAPPYVPLASFVRVVSFSLVLHVLFGIKPSAINLGEVGKATEAINRLWIQSKDPDSIPSLRDQRLLDNALEILLNESPCKDGTPPLNLIMPAYETLWRVVLLTFVSIANQNVDPRTTEELRKAVKHVPRCFGQRNDAEMQALAIAKEGLRLYPPTKRIYRATSTTDGENSFIAADVEKYHRDCQIWGPDALQFKPTRFHNWRRESGTKVSSRTASSNLNEERLKSASYFPFGVGGHICPAAGGFGDKIITLLVVELTRRFGTRQTGLEIHFGSVEVQQQVSTPLPSGRSDMENWVLEVKGVNW